MKSICCAVTNDIATDQRVLRTTRTLAGMGFRVTIIGRVLNGSLPLKTNDVKHRRYRMIFKKGPLFYLFLNVRLFVGILFRFPSVIWSNDMDTLPACLMVAKILRRPLIFDSHELFSEVPELQHRPAIKHIWLKLENYLIPKVDAGITVCESIARYYQEKYHQTFYVIRNVPYRSSYQRADKYPIQKFSTDKKHLVYQGMLNIGRGIEKMILAMHYLEEMQLHIIGQGDVEQTLKEMVKQEGLTRKVIFHGRIPGEKLQTLTPAFDLGLSLEENLGLNYYYALPNKLFAYIQAEIPVLVSDFPEMKKVVETYQIGQTTESVNAEQLARQIHDMLHNKSRYTLWQRNLKVAASELCWEKEVSKLKAIMEQYI